MKVYMAISDDKFELPVAIADTIVELARLTETTARTVENHVAQRNNKYRRKDGLRFVSVLIDDR